MLVEIDLSLASYVSLLLSDGRPIDALQDGVQVVDTVKYECACCGAEVWTTNGPPVEWKRPPKGKKFEGMQNPLICTGCQSRWGF